MYLLSQLIKNIVTAFATFFAFYTVRCSYDKTLSYLEFYNKIPIRYYCKDDKLPTMLICNGCYEEY